MKNLFDLAFIPTLTIVLFVGLCTLTSCSDQTTTDESKIQLRSSDVVVGNVSSGNATLTRSAATILTNWNLTLNQSGTPVNLKSVTIEEGANGYYLLARGDNFKSVTSLHYDSGSGILTYFDGTVTCTTSACATNSGCEVVGKKCSHCQGDCTKTTSGAAF